MNKKIIQKLQQIKLLTEECVVELSSKEILKKTLVGKPSEIQSIITAKIDFDMNERAFIKNYNKRMSGPKKFVLILAYLVKGKVGEEKSTAEIKKHWNKLKSVLKNQKKEKMKFNTYYVDVAKSNNWVDSKKYGFYFLTPHWKEIFIKKQL